MKTGRKLKKKKRERKRRKGEKGIVREWKKKRGKFNEEIGKSKKNEAKETRGI